jgi:hypothetical protein
VQTIEAQGVEKLVPSLAICMGHGTSSSLKTQIIAGPPAAQNRTDSAQILGIVKPRPAPGPPPMGLTSK